MLIFHADTALAAWAGARLGMEIAKPNTSIGVAHRGRIVAVAVFNNYRAPNIEITFVTSSSRWASPNAVRTIIRYPFLQLNCKRITAIIEATNQPARAFLCRLGFKLEGVHPDVFTLGAAETYGLLLKDAQRWVAEETHGKRISVRTDAGQSDDGLQCADHVESIDGGGSAGAQQCQPGRAERLGQL
jgi:RimJ/RimL family protein N-acetyltransferase